MARIRKLSIKRLIKEWREITQDEKDVHIAVCGDEGDGKSHLTNQFILGFPRSNLMDNVVYSSNHSEFYDKYEKLRIHGPLGIDEGLDFIDRQLWAKLDTKKLVKFVRGTVRKEKFGVFFYNAQLFRDFHGYWRNHRLRYWIEVLNRFWFDGSNVAVVYKKERVPFITGRRDTWLLDASEKSWLKSLSMYGKTDRLTYLKFLRKHPFYYGEFRFNALSDDLKKVYLSNRLEMIDQYTVQEEERDETKISKALTEVLKHCREDHGDRVDYLAMLTGFTTRTISRRLHSK